MKKTSTLLAMALFVVILCINQVKAANNVGLNGSATLNGWSEYGPVLMVQDPENSSVFNFNGYLNTGEFKVSTTAGWSPSWGPISNDTPLSSTSYSGALVKTDNKFLVETRGNYSITIDTTAMTVNIQPMSETTPILVNRLFIIGDATSSGWDLSTASELTRSNTNPWEFTYTGTLIGNKGFKFATSTGDWGQHFFMKTTDNQMFLDTTPDSKWSVSETGNYKITLNTRDLSISIQKYTPTGFSISEQNTEPQLTTVQGKLIIQNINKFSFLVQSISGAVITAGVSEDGEVNIASLIQGVYIMKITSDKAESTVFKFVKK